MTEDERKRLEAHERLKMSLRLNGTSLAAEARKLNVSRTTLSLVGLRKLKNARIEQALANAIGVPVSELFDQLQSEEDEK
ncbi:MULTISPECIES: helix-turn-helix domain-containing protein [unclassified Ruegeria]|uniref:helix-turn-helix domain-containing protein n=1 Tax=unclassified Ruegeria TaxID=2625375 RepID=UPI001ADCAA71|nr:helix-turn-helix domain-containing protein [Ruegeria sp. R8_1]MBO9414960.1 helix-turn-helix domain-containing protein [Ruegeria sp. R8_2]